MKRRKSTTIYLSQKCKNCAAQRKKRSLTKIQPAITVIVVDGSKNYIVGAEVILISTNGRVSNLVYTDNRGEATFIEHCIREWDKAKVIVSYEKRCKTYDSCNFNSGASSCKCTVTF